MGRSQSQSSAPTSIAILAPRVQHVSRTAICKRWRPLQPTAQDKIKQMVLSLKAQSRATKKIHGGRKQLALGDELGEEVVREVADRLVARLPRMPFPPSTDETHFDFEYTLDRISMRESQLSAATQAMQLLRTQIKREERALKRDEMELEVLRDGLKGSERARKAREGRLHPLARDLKRSEDHDDEVQADGVEMIGASATVTLTNIDGDAKLDPLVKQLRSHLESLRNNTAGLKSVVKGLDETQNAVDQFTYRGLSRRQYEDVYSLNQL